MRRVVVAALACALAACPGAVFAQNLPTGSVTVSGDYFPNRDDTAELRSRLFAEEKIEPTPGLRVTLSGFAEGLVARRPVAGRIPGAPTETAVETDAIVKVHDASIELRGERFDLLAGYARVIWGKLDEIQPTDVVNPLDASRFFFEGRSEARLPVLVVRGRAHLSENVAVEAVYSPDFRKGRFDQLAEATSPFNITASVGTDVAACLAVGCPTLPPTVDDRQPALTWRNAQGGARVSATTRRVDWSVSAYRGFDPFGIYTLAAAPVSSGATIVLEYPRFTMVGADVEAVRGKWGLRGEIAAFVDDSFQSPDLRMIPGSSIDAGMGVDRRAGDFTVSGTVLFHSESYDADVGGRSGDGRSDVSLIGSADRTFGRERYRFRGFAVFNATESSAFFRGIGIANLRDNVALETSIGWFVGSGRDLVGRFADSDFAYVRLKYYF